MFKLKELRTKNKISQQRLADLLGVSRSTVSMWEIELSEPDNQSLLKLAEILNTTTDYLLGKTDIKNTEPVGSVSEDDIKIALFGGDAEVTDEMWKEAKGFAEYIKERERRKKES